MKEGETYGQMVIHLPGQFRETASNHSNRTEQVYRYKEWARPCHEKSGGRYRQMGLQAETNIKGVILCTFCPSMGTKSALKRLLW